VESSVFLDFHLPNAATWFYFSLILAVALFFQFARVFCLRNLDLLALFLLAPGFLILQEAHDLLAIDPKDGRGRRELLLGYGWLLAASAYWFGRAIFDLALVRRPALGANLATPGLACLGIALFIGQTSVALRRTADPSETVKVGKLPAPIAEVSDTATNVVKHAPAETIQRASREDVGFWVERGLCMLCHAAIVVGLLFVGLRHFQDRTAGIGMGALYLLIPYTAYDVGRQLHHVWPTAFLVWAIFCYRRPTAAGWLLGLAAGTALFPIVLLPLWVAFYSRRGAMRFSVSFLAAAAVSVGVTALILWWDGRGGFGLSAALSLPDWQPWRNPATESIWTGAHWAYRMPLFVLFVAFVIGVTVWPSPKNLSHLIALSAALLIGVQFWHADRGGVYVLWYLPLLLLMVFRPNLTAAEPPAIEPGGGLMARIARVAWWRSRPEQSRDLAV
jgi:hypothetical protein